VNQETVKKIFVDHIRDLYDAEKQLVKALPKLAKASESEELGDALRTHLEETQGHVARLEQVFKAMGKAAKGKPCKGMQGLIEEGNEAIQEKEEGPERDLAIIAGGQKVEHYEMSAYGTARALAEQMGMNEVVELLQQTEDEEENADATLTQCATSILESSDEEEHSAAMGASPSSTGSASPTRTSKKSK
jgi:ferritin-like metal-binding protein YciE